MFLTCYFYFVDSNLCISGKMDFNLFFTSFIFLWAQWVQNAFNDLNTLFFSVFEVVPSHYYSLRSWKLYVSVWYKETLFKLYIANENYIFASVCSTVKKRIIELCESKD